MTDFASKPKTQIAPSLLSADFMNLARDVAMIEQGAPDWLHVDVMDGHLVPNLTIGVPAVKALRAITPAPLDVHLMIDNPEEQLDWYIDAGADLITLHLECAGIQKRCSGNPIVFDDDLQSAASGQGSSVYITELNQPELIISLIQRIKTAGRKAGLAITPGTEAKLVLPFLKHLDLVMIMSVHPGFGGQNLIESTLTKVSLISEAAISLNPDILIEVDGGINISTAPQAVAAGANLLVAGNAIFAEPDPLAALAALRAAI